MITVGGSSFTPGSPETLSVTGLDATQSSAVFRYSTLEVTGSLSGSVWSFAFTADDTGVFDPTPNRFDCQIVYGDSTITPVVLRTGERKNGTEPTVPPGTTRVSSVIAGTGLSSVPNPITSKGTINIDAALNQLNDVSISGATNSQVLKYTSGTWSNQDESGGGGGSTALDDLTDVTITSASADDFLSYSGSEWVNRSIPFMPEPGASNRVRVGKVWNPLLSTPALVDVYRRSFYLAAGGTGNPTGDITLISSGVSWCLGGYGYLEAASGVRYSLPQDSPGISGGIRINTDGSLIFKRGAQVDDADSGYFVAVDIIDS
jgi:hypothetical protein